MSNPATPEPTTKALEVAVWGPSGRQLEVKQEERNGVPVGIVAGYIATWDPDTGGIFGMPDQFVEGAFAASIEEHRSRGNRQVRLKDHHGRTIGGFPIATVKEDSIGLFGRGEINLETQLGREAFSLARQGVLSDFSVGFVALDDAVEGDIRRITKADLIEGSIVDEPANRAAKITEVKSLDLGELKAMTVREVEKALVDSGVFSKGAAKALASAMKRVEEEPEPDLSAALFHLLDAKSILRS
jgi:HK97 family phage prohead protease